MENGSWTDCTYNAPKSAKEFQQQIKKLDNKCNKFAQDLEFEKAAAVRDQLHQLREQFMVSELIN